MLEEHPDLALAAHVSDAFQAKPRNTVVVAEPSSARAGSIRYVSYLYLRDSERTAGALPAYG